MLWGNIFLLFSTFPDTLLQQQIEYMKATVNTSELQKKLSYTQHAISSRAQLPILLNILLEVANGLLTLRGTDLEIGIETRISATDIVDGGVTVPAKPFIELIAALSDEEVILEVSEGSLRVATKRTKTVFQTTPSDEFPRLYGEKGEQILSLPIEQFQQDLARVVFAASTDTTRLNLSGVLLKPTEKGFLLVATDGYRLSMKKSEGVELGQKVEASLLIPSRVFRELVSIKENVKVVSLFISKEQNQVLFTVGETVLVGRLIDAAFPPYEKILPTDVSSTITFDKEQMIKAVRMCSIFARDAANIIKFSLRKEKMIISSQAASLGENTVEVEAHLVGEENEIAFNARYIVDVLANMTSEEILLEMTGPLNPGVFKMKGDESFFHLIMPIRVQG